MKCIVIQTAFLGDVILTVPLLGLLRRDRRVSWLGVVASPPGAAFLEGQRIADEVVTYDKRAADSGLPALARLIRSIGHAGADAALVPHRSFRSAFIAAAAGVPRRIGFDVSGGRLLLTDAVAYRALPHEVERVVSLAAPLGIAPPEGRVPFSLTVPDGAEEELEKVVVEELGTSAREGSASAGRGGAARLDGAVVVAPGSRWATKRWPADRFAGAAGRAAAELGALVAVVGSGDERDVGAEVSRAVAGASVDLTGRLSLGGLLALLARSRVVLSNDSAVAHMAAGLGRPVVAVFGPTVPAQGFAPYSDLAAVAQAPLDCRPCGRHGSDRCRLGTLDCMKRVSVEEVAARAVALAREEGARA